jgi:hypothetical protein
MIRETMKRFFSCPLQIVYKEPCITFFAALERPKKVKPHFPTLVKSPLLLRSSLLLSQPRMSKMNSIIIPAAEQTETTFTYKGETFNKNLAANTIQKLTGLLIDVAGVDWRGKKKDELVNVLYRHVCWTPQEEAWARWPVLKEAYEIAANPSATKEQLAAMCNRLFLDVPNQMEDEGAIDFLSHAVHARLRVGERLDADETRARKEKDNAEAPPAWYDEVPGWITENGFKEPKGMASYIKVRVRCDQMDHDGYCSGADEEDAHVAKSEVYVGVLPSAPEGTYDFSKESWKGGASCTGGCGCCGVRETYTLLNATPVLATASPQLPAPGDFTEIKKLNSFAYLVEDAYNATTTAGAWDFFRNERPPAETGYMFWAHPTQKLVEKEMKCMDQHSGASYGWTMRTLQSIARDGWESYVRGVLSAHRKQNEKDA